MMFADVVERTVKEAVDVYIHFKMKKPDWAELVTTKEEVADSLRTDSESHFVLDPVFYLMRKLDSNMSKRLFDNAAATLIEEKKEWFPKLKKQEGTSNESTSSSEK